MAGMKTKKPQRTPEDVEQLKSDVASFASTLGFAGAASSAAGFDDSDFRKSGRIKPLKPPKTRSNPKPIDRNSENEEDSTILKPKLKPHPLDMDPFTSSDKKRDAPKLPLMKASSLSAQWYVDADELEVKVLGEEGRRRVPAMGIEDLRKLADKKKAVAERLMVQYAEDYDASRRKNGDMRLLEVTARSGTSTDKVSAFTCLVEDNPIANMRSLDALLSMVTSKVGKRYAFTGFEAIKELFLLRLLPDRKLKCLIQRPLDNLPESKDGFSLLLFWYWEESLKQRYERFVIALEEALKDMLANLKDKAMKTVYILLKTKPEQERRLLTALVNKLGDPERKAASSAAYHLSCLLSAHPNMKAVVIDEVDSFIFRPHIGLRAKYQAVNFLSQIFLTRKGDGPKTAKRLVDVYFAVFKLLMSEGSDGDTKGGKKSCKKDEKGKRTNLRKNDKEHTEPTIEMDSRLLSALLTGVNRAFPFVASDEADDVIEAQTPILFKLVHAENFNVGVQALMLLYQISSKNQIASDRFYRALYAKLLTPTALNSSKPEMFLGLLVKAMKTDMNLKRVSAFSKRLLQVSLQRPPQYACGCLFVLSEVLKAKPPLWSMALQNESIDDELEHFEDIIEGPEDAPGSPPRKESGNSNVCAALANGGTIPASHSEVDYSSGEDLNDGEPIQPLNYGDKEKAQAPNPKSAAPVVYNPRHREPCFCNADRTNWLELTILAAHVHPSVATMARTLLSGANIVYNGDPLNDLSLNAFLDKFMEKKPKANRRAEGRWHGGSQIAPARKLDMNHRFIGEEILELAEEEVPPEDVVFHRFYMNKTSSLTKRKAKKKKVTEDEGAEELLPGISDESEEEEIDKMLGSGRIPQEDTEGDYDYDDLDRVADEDDDYLLGDGSDTEVGVTNETKEEHNEEQLSDDDEDEDVDLDDVEEDILGLDDNSGSDDSGVGSDEGDEPKQTDKGKKKQKLKGKTHASPFASLEDYEYLMHDAEKTKRKSKPELPNKKKKKRKTSNLSTLHVVI